MLVTVDEYNALGFEGGDDENIEKALLRAERLIDIMTDGKCREVEKLSAPAVDNLKQAICAQCEQMIVYTGLTADNEPWGGEKVSLGDYSYEAGTCQGIQLSSIALAILKLSGLFYRGTEARYA